ncbi:hypothetical protein PFISCL1PPCAC_9457, partial [Pristionchus fissidentatus]
KKWTSAWGCANKSCETGEFADCPQNVKKSAKVLMCGHIVCLLCVNRMTTDSKDGTVLCPALLCGTNLTK